MMRRKSRRAVLLGLLLSMVGGPLGGCNGAPPGNLFYVWPSAGCPRKSSPANQNKPAGFTSRSVAAAIAATETAGPPHYWRDKEQLYHREMRQLNASSGSPASKASPRATIVAELAQARTQLASYGNCFRYVRRGKPNPAYPY